MAGRSFAGFACQERVSLSLFGEVFRARSSRGDEGRVVIIDERLAARPGFASELAAVGSAVNRVRHANLVSTRTVGRARDGSLVVVTGAVEGGVELSSLLDDGPLPIDVALGVAAGVLTGLAHAHEHAVVHGGVHPRSVVVDAHGVARLTDFALARAMIAAATRADDPALLAGMKGYLAPEQALGQQPDARSDVYTTGALLRQLVCGDPASIDPAPGARLEEIITRACATNPDARFASAVELGRELFAAAADDDLDVASPLIVAAYVAGLPGRGREASDDDLDAETEGFLADLAGPRGDDDDSETPGGGALVGAVGLRSSRRRAVSDVLAALDSEPGPSDSEILAAAETYSRNGIDFEGELTEVDDSRRDADSLSKILGLGEVDVASVPLVRRSSTPRPADFDFDETPLPPPQPFHEDRTASISTDALAERRRQSEKILAARMPVIEAAVPGEGDDEPAARKSGLVWWAVIAFVAASVGVIVYTQSDVLHPERVAAREAERERQRERAEKELEDSRARAGEIVVRSDTEDAAVWLLLGRTPLESFALPSSMVHELRLEHPGYRSIDLRVTAQHWSGDGEERRAELSATLSPGEDRKPLPPSPPAPAQPPTAGGPGSGTIAVESSPSGAAVWMLVGFTPEVRIGGLPAGRDYELEVLATGHRPAFASVKADDWYLSGPDGPMVPSLTREVELRAAGSKARKSPRRRGKRR